MSDSSAEQNEHNEKYTKQDIERARAEETSAKLDALIAILPAQDETDDMLKSDAAGKTRMTQRRILDAPQENSTLRRSGISRVEIGRTSGLDEAGGRLYPEIRLLEAYNLEGLSQDTFMIIDDGNEPYICKPDEAAGGQLVGLDENDQLTRDIEAVQGPVHMLPVGMQVIDNADYANLTAIRIACEADLS